MVRMMRQVVMIGAGIGVSLTVFVLVMQYGYGIEPRSWPWVLAVYPAGQVVAHVIAMLAHAEQQ